VTAIAKFMKSSIGCKVIMALTGLGLVGFLIAHISGNLLMYKGPEAINAYAKMLRDYMGILWFLRIGLLTFLVLHVYSAIRLTRLNRRQDPYKYKAKSQKKGSLSSRTMMLTGLTVFFFVLYHLAHFTMRWTHPEFHKLSETDVYTMVVTSFQSPLLSLFYILSVSFLMSHLVHGLKSFWRTLGLRHKKYNNFLDKASVALGLILALSFISIPVSVYLGIIK